MDLNSLIHSFRSTDRAPLIVGPTLIIPTARLISFCTMKNRVFFVRLKIDKPGSLHTETDGNGKSWPATNDTHHLYPVYFHGVFNISLPRRRTIFFGGPDLYVSLGSSDELVPGATMDLPVVIGNSGTYTMEMYNYYTIQPAYLPTTAKFVTVMLLPGDAPVKVRSNPRVSAMSRPGRLSRGFYCRDPPGCQGRPVHDAG